MTKEILFYVLLFNGILISALINYIIISKNILITKTEHVIQYFFWILIFGIVAYFTTVDLNIIQLIILFINASFIWWILYDIILNILREKNIFYLGVNNLIDNILYFIGYDIASLIFNKNSTNSYLKEWAYIIGFLIKLIFYGLFLLNLWLYQSVVLIK
jgi:hypothetical protein